MAQIFFAWADATERTFDADTHAREDEDVFSFTLAHEEGQIPTLDVVLRYPEVAGVAIGLLRAGRKQWCWLSWRNPEGVVEPLFFGRMVGLPSNINDVIVPIRFHSRAPDFVAQKQALADTLRSRPFYDPIFLSDQAIEDPESILEGWSCSYHVDRQTLEWTISDILTGEDGTVYFDQGDIIDGSVEVQIKQAPLRAVRVDATVHWSQFYRNTIIPIVPMTQQFSYNPQGLADSWPKPGASVGGGWVVANGSAAVARGGVAGAVQNDSGSWRDESTNHNDGDAVSIEWNASIPLGGTQFNLKVNNQSYGSIGGGVDFLNTPPGEISTGDQPSTTTSSYSASWQVVYAGSVQCSLYVRPDGSPNHFTETISLTLEADLQSILTDPTSQEETEVIELQGQDIGQAYIDYKCLTTLSGQAVQAGQIMLPNLTPGPGGTSYQIALNAGTCGVVTSEEDAPLFSDVPGGIVSWGSVEWCCVGASLPSIADWSPQSFITTGTLLCAESAGGWFFLALNDGFTGKYSPFELVVTPVPFLPSGPIPAPGISSAGAHIGDGGVTWLALGSGGPSLHVPAAGLPGNIVSNSFFDQDRGAAAIEYMIMVARNKIRTRSRAIEIKFRTPFANAVALSCRKNASVHVPKIIPGGWATGKVISYTLNRSGLTGEVYAEVTIGCAVGSGSSDAAAVIGTPTVADLDALEASAQHMDGAAAMIGSEVSYQPPPPNWTNNGFRYPLTRDQVVLQAGWNSTRALQLQNLMEQLARPGGTSMLTGLKGAIGRAQQANLLGAKQWDDPYYYEFWLRPISDQHSETPYYVNVSKLLVPKQINLEA